MSKDNTKYRNENRKDDMCVICDLSQLESVRDFITLKALSFGFSEDEAYKISLAVDEACTNLIRYAYNLDPNRKICINIETLPSQFIVNVLDDGLPFNPLEIPSPEMKQYFKEFRRGGLGIHIMRSVMDSIEYKPSTAAGVKNVLRLIKNLSEIKSSEHALLAN
jgi:serine/threonine-protein kinase RsbW